MESEADLQMQMECFFGNVMCFCLLDLFETWPTVCFFC